MIKTNKAFRSIVDWRVKNKFLKDQINKLESLKIFPILSVALFLLKTQLIEFELKQLITGIDQYLYFGSLGKRKNPRTPIELDNRRMTLGILKEEIKKYKLVFLKHLVLNLSKLVILRNEFVHSLFNPGTLKDLIKKSIRGFMLTEKVIKNIEVVNKFLDKYDPLKLKNKN